MALLNVRLPSLFVAPRIGLRFFDLKMISILRACSACALTQGQHSQVPFLPSSTMPYFSTVTDARLMSSSHKSVTTTLTQPYGRERTRSRGVPWKPNPQPVLNLPNNKRERRRKGKKKKVGKKALLEHDLHPDKNKRAHTCTIKMLRTRTHRQAGTLACTAHTDQTAHIHTEGRVMKTANMIKKC